MTFPRTKFTGLTPLDLGPPKEENVKAEAEVKARAQAREELRAKGPLKKQQIFV